MGNQQLLKLGRNDPCHCGSGKKFKHCCLHTNPSQPATMEEIDQRAQQAVAKADFAGAEYWFRQMLTIKPNDAYALACIGQSLCWRHKRREGAAYLLQAAKHLEKQAAKSGNTQFPLELSGQLLHWGEVQAAVKLAYLAIKLEPDSLIALNTLVLCLTRINRDAEALPICQKLCELLPDEPRCNILLAIIESRTGDKSAAYRRLERVITQNRDCEQTARAHLELAALLDSRGDYDAAFASLSKASETNIGLPRNIAVSREYIFSCISANKAGFNLELLQRSPSALLSGDGLPAPAFLVGFPRSGTTLTEQVLGAHPGIIATDESSIVLELTLKLAEITNIKNNIPAALEILDIGQLRALRSFFWQRMREEHGEDVMKKQLVDKNALNTIDLGFISVVFPEAKILFALRDPRDICISCFMQSFSTTPATVNLLSWEGIAGQYAAVMDYWLYLKHLMQPGFLELRYEDAVGDFETTYRGVFEFLNLDWAPEVSRYYERAKGRYISTPSFADVCRPIYKTAVARWKNYERHLQPILPRLERFIESFGYVNTRAD